MSFKKGSSGNLRGRPKGIQDKRTALRSLLEPHAPALVDTVVRKALKGDMTAARICLDRLIPPVKARNEVAKFPGVGATLADQGKAILDAARRGDLSPDEVSMFMHAISAQASIVKVDDLERRVATLEECRNGKH
jgi:hypothetical protein